jgi:hypothetical protein
MLVGSHGEVRGQQVLECGVRRRVLAEVWHGDCLWSLGFDEVIANASNAAERAEPRLLGTQMYSRAGVSGSD